jgi:hypothetical protein
MEIEWNKYIEAEERSKYKSKQILVKFLNVKYSKVKIKDLIII